MAFPPPNSGQWSTGLCGCFQDMESCCVGLWCPWKLVGRTVEILDQGAETADSAACFFLCLQCWTVCCCGFAYTCGYRGRLRRKFGLPPIPCGDCLTDFCCLNCSLCQIHRELDNRGINPRLGYAGVKEVYNVRYDAPHQQCMQK